MRPAISIIGAAGVFAVAGYLVGGSMAMAALMAVVGMALACLWLDLARKQSAIDSLQRRMFDCEEGKASKEWVARIEADTERDIRLLDREIERVSSL